MSRVSIPRVFEAFPSPFVCFFLVAGMVAFITEEGIVEKGTTTAMVGRTGWTKTGEAVVCSRFS